jgi:hypothetical protein
MQSLKSALCATELLASRLYNTNLQFGSIVCLTYAKRDNELVKVLSSTD